MVAKVTACQFQVILGESYIISKYVQLTSLIITCHAGMKSSE